MINARLHFVQRTRFAPVTVDLSPAGYSGLDLVADHVALYQVTVNFVVCHGMGSWSDDAHAALKNVHKLGQLIQRIFSQKSPDARSSWA